MTGQDAACILADVRGLIWRTNRADFARVLNAVIDGFLADVAQERGRPLHELATVPDDMKTKIATVARGLARSCKEEVGGPEPTPEERAKEELILRRLGRQPAPFTGDPMVDGPRFIADAEAIVTWMNGASPEERRAITAEARTVVASSRTQIRETMGRIS